jgi:hypothetical protein
MKYHQIGKDNLSKEHRMFLKNIKAYLEVIIKKADKGSAVVIINTQDYLRKGYKQLDDRN